MGLNPAHQQQRLSLSKILSVLLLQVPTYLAWDPDQKSEEVVIWSEDRRFDQNPYSPGVENWVKYWTWNAMLFKCRSIYPYKCGQKL